MALYYGLSVDLVLPVILYLYRLCVFDLVIAHLFKGGALSSSYWSIHGLCQIAGAANIVDFVNVFPVCKPCAELLHLMLAHAVHEEVGAAVKEYGGTHSVVPVVVMCETPQRGFEPAYGYGNVSEVFTELLTVHYNCTVGAFACGFRELEVINEIWGDDNPCQIYVMSLA